VSTPDIIPALLLMVLSLALTSGAAIVLIRARWYRKQQNALPLPDASNYSDCLQQLPSHAFSHRPNTWIAVRSRSLHCVQAALGLSNPRPCTWIQGLTCELKLFIAPPIHGWVLITGSGVPDPSEDVDSCYKFLVDLSRKLGQVHFFHANAAVGHHAWVRVDAGRVLRAYAWAGETLWNQGPVTQPEIDLGIQCLDYFERPGNPDFSSGDGVSLNAEKVPQLAALWSIDPAAIDERTLDQAFGIAGEPSRLY
jgi:hypothetical protein